MKVVTSEISTQNLSGERKKELNIATNFDDDAFIYHVENSIES